MVNLESVFKNYFEATRISDDKLNKFVQTHLERLASHDDGLSPDLLTNTQQCYEAYFGGITNEMLQASIRKSHTKTTDNLITEFKAFVSRHEGTIRGHFGKDAPKYLEFFPQGVTEYNNATKTTIEALMLRFLSALRNAPELGTELADQFTSLYSNYISSRKLQLGKISEVSSSKVGTAESRLKVEQQLLVNIHKIAAAFPGNVSKCMSYFDQSMLHGHSSTPEVVDKPIADFRTAN